MSRELVGDSALGLFLLAYLLSAANRSQAHSAEALLVNVCVTTHTRPLGTPRGVSSAEKPKEQVKWSRSGAYLDKRSGAVEFAELAGKAETLSSTRILKNCISFTRSCLMTVGLVNK